MVIPRGPSLCARDLGQCVLECDRGSFTWKGIGWSWGGRGLAGLPMKRGRRESRVGMGWRTRPANRAEPRWGGGRVEAPGLKSSCLHPWVFGVKELEEQEDHRQLWQCCQSWNCRVAEFLLADPGQGQVHCNGVLNGVWM